MVNGALAKTKSILQRNMNGVGLTTIVFDDTAPPAMIVEKTARVALLAIERAELIEAEKDQDLSRMEFGSIEGEVYDGTSWHGRPALKIKERLTGADVTCVLSSELRAEIGPKRPLDDVWSHPRVLISGEIYYRKDGMPIRVMAFAITQIEAEPLTMADIADPNFTGGKSPREHIASHWDDDE
jgi:hypothetical protein